MYEINESDCCGNGCANCILDIKPKFNESVNKTSKPNILVKYTKFLLINKILHNPEVEDVWELHFKSKQCNDDNSILIINAGHHLMMRKVLTVKENLKKNENDAENQRKYLLRPYSPFWWNVMAMEFKILINIIPNGPMSEYLKHLEINDEVEFRGPIGTFYHQVDEKGVKYLLILSQGIAITSVIPIIEEILNNEDDMTRIVHIACFKDLKHFYFRDKLNNFNKFWNYKVHIFLAKEFCDSSACRKELNCLQTCHNFQSKLKYNEIVKPCRFTENELIQIINNLKYVKENVFFLISGKENFQGFYKKSCQTIEAGFLENNIHLL